MNTDRCKSTLNEINRLTAASRTERIRIMEVCGSHTMAIARHGLKQLLPEKLTLLSGPGCPVCVTDEGYIDALIDLARREEAVVCTFGDMIKVPGRTGSLELARSEGADVRVVYSPLDALAIAAGQTDRQIVLAAVGFETTAPLIAAVVQQAAELELANFSILPAHKLVPPALSALMDDPASRIDAFLCPGHVSTIIGSAAYEPIAAHYTLPSVVAGFDPADILESIVMILKQLANGEGKVENQYRRIVTRFGNRRAQATLEKVFEPVDAVWRGLGPIPLSGLRVRREYAAHNSYVVFGLSDEPDFKEGPCQCGEVLKGQIAPRDCRIFGSACTPRTPIGPCMVSSEGACSAEYKYGTALQASEPE